MSTDFSAAAISPRKMIAPDEALQLVIDAASVNATVAVSLANALDLRLAETICADRNYPPFARAMMDGFAVRADDAGAAVQVIGEIAAGAASDLQIKPGEAVRIMTGAACPASANAVVQIESIETCEDGSSTITLPDSIAAGRNIAPEGSDCPVERAIASAGDIVTSLTVAAAASVGAQMLSVIPAPALSIITTGDELVRNDAVPERTQIRDSNGPMLRALAATAALIVQHHTHAKDTAEGLAEALADTGTARLVILTGGVSAGKYDLVPAALIAHGAEIIFHKVKQKPGKPLLFARKDETLYFGLPGNPLASHLGFLRYVIAAANVMRGGSGEPKTFTATLTNEVPPVKGRTLFRLATAVFDQATGGYRVTPAPGAGSADVFGPQQANCFLRLEIQDTPHAAGKSITCLWL